MGAVRREDFLSGGWKGLLRDFMHTPAGQIVERRLAGLANLLAPRGLAQIQAEAGVASAPGDFYDRSRAYSRPPGADPESFESLCDRCGDCVRACPYGVIFTQGPESGPLLEPNLMACRLCSDYPCIRSCPTGALQSLPQDTLPRFGVARLRTEACLNSIPPAQGKRRKICRECAASCPVANVIDYDRQALPRIAEHCTGCGLCVAVCPTSALQVEVGA